MSDPTATLWPHVAVAFLGVLLIFALILPSQVMARIDSPCNKICLVQPGGEMCVGCGRTLDEIARWTAIAAAERSRIMDELPRRLAALRDPRAARPVV